MYFDTNVKIIQEKKKELQTLMEEMLVPMFEKLFDLVPELKELNWKQYVPYFNDGDECVFGIHSVNFIPYENEHIIEPEYIENGFSLPSSFYTWMKTGVVPKYYTQEEFELYKKFLEIVGSDRLEQINNIIKEFESLMYEMKEALQQTYGTHAYVVVERNDTGGIVINVEEYENHD